jgi:hypothetical protein
MANQPRIPTFNQPIADDKGATSRPWYFFFQAVYQFIAGANVTTGTHTATFSATNKPGTATTAPTAWLPIVIGNTTYYIPLWQ